MLSIVKHHACFTLEQVRAYAIVYRPLFDEYDTSNDFSAVEFLLNSVELQIAEYIARKHNRSGPCPDTFDVAWMLFIQKVGTTSAI